MKDKILILGSTSFAGASLVDFLLKKNFDVIGVFKTKREKKYLPYSINKNKKFFRNYRIDYFRQPKKIIKLVGEIKPNYIVDFASICMVNDSWIYAKQYFEANVIKNINLIKYLNTQKFLKKFIYISTPEVFGSSKNFIKEDNDLFNPSTPYATSKLSAEMVLKNYQRSFNLPLVIARFSNFYGPGQPLYRLIPKIISCISLKTKFPLEGKGNTSRNFIFSYDFCNGIYRVLKKGKIGSVYHFSGNRFYQIKEIIKNICKIKKVDFKKFVRKVPNRLGQDFMYKLSSLKTQKELKWKPIYSLTQGLKEVIIYHKKYFKNISKKELNYKKK